MKITYGILTHNEGRCISDLLDVLVKYINMPQSCSLAYYQDIVILDDYSTDASTQMILRQAGERTCRWSAKACDPLVTVSYRKHSGDFSEQKNALNKLCTGEWIVNLDADEMVTEEFLRVIPILIRSNPQVEAFWAPRINTVEGLTSEHVERWGWHLTRLPNIELPVINYPDVQMRVYRNIPEITWINKVHEQLIGYKVAGSLHGIPNEFDYAIRHHKHISKQEQQNSLYTSMMKENKP